MIRRARNRRRLRLEAGRGCAVISGEIAPVADPETRATSRGHVQTAPFVDVGKSRGFFLQGGPKRRDLRPRSGGCQ